MCIPPRGCPGTRELEAELQRRVRSGEKFAACYADLDHFKEFNDRYGYHNGDHVIRLLARILHDVVKGLCGESGSSDTSGATTSSTWSRRSACLASVTK
jgi:hypothetical protein